MIINELKDFKEKNNLTLDYLARELDFHQNSIHRWLTTGKINKMYAKVLKVRLRKLKERRGNE